MKSLITQHINFIQQCYARRTFGKSDHWKIFFLICFFSFLILIDLISEYSTKVKIVYFFKSLILDLTINNLIKIGLIALMLLFIFIKFLIIPLEHSANEMKSKAFELLLKEDLNETQLNNEIKKIFNLK